MGPRRAGLSGGDGGDGFGRGQSPQQGVDGHDRPGHLAELLKDDQAGPGQAGVADGGDPAPVDGRADGFEAQRPNQEQEAREDQAGRDGTGRQA